MATWDSYTTKTKPEDNDTLMIKDTAGAANKRTPFSAVWNWIVDKLTSAVISSLSTNSKSIIPAINELNSKFEPIDATDVIATNGRLTFKADVNTSYSRGSGLYVFVGKVGEQKLFTVIFAKSYSSGSSANILAASANLGAEVYYSFNPEGLVSVSSSSILETDNFSIKYYRLCPWA